jgi:ribosomal-protein-alanine N-acetyltransferase
LLEGKTVNLRVIEKEDVDFMFEWTNNPDFSGEYSPIAIYGQNSRAEWVRGLDNPSDMTKLTAFREFIIEKKDGTRIGLMHWFANQPYGTMEVSCFLVPSERGKGYGAEATQLMVDYVFLRKDIVRIQTHTNVGNKKAQNALKKVGFQIEGTARKFIFVRGVWADYYLLSILREEWKEPRILTKTN